MRSFFMNSIKLEHWTGSTWEEIPHIVFPVSFSDLLDERLDELFVTFYNSEQEQYKPTDIFIITLFEGDKEALTKGFCAATDNVNELPLGSGNYKHELALIEPTKLAEGVMCQTLTFTNNLGKSYTANEKPLILTIPDQLEGMFQDPTNIATLTPYKEFDFGIKSPIHSGSKLPSLREIGNRMAQIHADKIAQISGTTIEITDQVFYGSEQSKIVLNEETITNLDSSPTLNNPHYDVTYKLIFAEYDENGTLVDVRGAQYGFSLTVVVNKLPLLPYTITDVVCRCLELAEPLTTSETPRIVFDGVSYRNGLTGAREYATGSQADTYSKQFAPELAITQANLREQLKRIGGYIHAEPRIEVVRDGNAAPTFKLYYDKLIASEKADLSEDKAHLTYRGISRSINEYNTEVRSNASNLVNSLDYGQGVVTEPYVGGYKSLRADLNQRMSEENAYATTEKGVYAITRVMCGIKLADNSNWQLPPLDITAYVLERTAYDLLSDYEKNFPEAKSLALYYTQGQEGIHGLFYKSTTVSSMKPWGNYAIIRILARESGETESQVANVINRENGIHRLVFQVSYIPIYENMISHSKQKYTPNETPFAQAYSQSDNLIETRYFGENIKGVAARLGNVEEQRTYSFKSAADLPKIGQMVDGFVIAAVDSQFMPTYTKATLSLVKKFNRISEYVGVNSNKRVYEVSEREAYERHILIKNKIVFSTRNLSTMANAPLTPNRVMGAFYGASDGLISAVGFTAHSNNKNKIGNSVLLPVISSAFGNAMTFTFSMKDNYSAGEQLIEADVDENVSGYWEKDVPYSDYYGRISNVDIYLKNVIGEAGLSGADSLPECEITTDGAIKVKSLFIDKDSRERLSFTLELEAQTTEDDIIIGSGFASGNPLVTTNVRKPRLYVYSAPFTEFATTLDDKNGTMLKAYGEGEGFTYADGKITFFAISQADLSNKKGYWCIAYPKMVGNEEEYEDKYGATVEATPITGGEILLASTTPIVPKLGGALIHKPIYISIQK